MKKKDVIALLFSCLPWVFSASCPVFAQVQTRASGEALPDLPEEMIPADPRNPRIPVQRSPHTNQSQAPQSQAPQEENGSRSTPMSPAQAAQVQTVSGRQPRQAESAVQATAPSEDIPLPAAEIPRTTPLATAIPDAIMTQRGSPEEDEAFRAILRSVSPLTEQQLRVLRRLFDRQALVLAEPPSGVMPRPVTRAVSLTLRPGEDLPRLKLFAGNATSITFSDITGAPWPIQSVTIGNPQAFAVSEAGERGKTNMLVVSPLTQRVVANNMVVTLVGHPAPVVLGIEAGGEEVDFRVDVTIRARGPNAAPQVIQSSGISPTNDRVVQAFLDGVPPREAVSLRSSSRDVEIWRLGDRMYVRTPFEMLSPAYEARARNVSGMNVFTLSETPVLLLSENGRMFQVSVRDARNTQSNEAQRQDVSGLVRRIIQDSEQAMPSRQ